MILESMDNNSPQDMEASGMEKTMNNGEEAGSMMKKVPTNEGSEYVTLIGESSSSSSSSSSYGNPNPNRTCTCQCLSCCIIVSKYDGNTCGRGATLCQIAQKRAQEEEDEEEVNTEHENLADGNINEELNDEEYYNDMVDAKEEEDRKVLLQLADDMDMTWRGHVQVLHGQVARLRKEDQQLMEDATHDAGCGCVCTGRGSHASRASPNHLSPPGPASPLHVYHLTPLHVGGQLSPSSNLSTPRASTPSPLGIRSKSWSRAWDSAAATTSLIS